MGVSYLLPVLTEAGKLDTAYRLLMQDTFPSWLFSVKHGATTIWERWDGWTPEQGFQDPGMNSFNHYALGSCGQWLFDTVAGIGLDPAQPGFRHIIIHPRPGGGLTWAKAFYRSIRGPIATEWSFRSDGTLALGVTIPVGTTATVYLPASDPRSLRESGKPLQDAEGVRLLRREGACACWKSAPAATIFRPAEGGISRMKGLFSAAAPGEGGSFISVAFCQKIATVPTGAAGNSLCQTPLSGILNFLSSSTSQDCFRASTGSITSSAPQKISVGAFPG